MKTKNKQIEALDLAISQLQKEKEKVIQEEQRDRKKKEKASLKKISAKDKSIIAHLTQLCKWWRTKGLMVEKTIKVTIKANLLWTEDRSPYVDGYNFFVNNEEVDFDEMIRGGIFENELARASKSINKICDQADKLEAKYDNIDLKIFT